MNDAQISRDKDFSPGCSSFQQEKECSCVSMRSDGSMGEPIRFKSGDTQTELSSVQQKRSEPESSCVSMRSDTFMNQPLDYTSEDTKTDLRHDVLNVFRSNLMKKFERLYEVTVTQENPTLLNEIYTELYITESESGEISNEHEVRQIETQSRRAATEDTAIKCNDIFRPLPGQDTAIRTVLTKGVAGIGKTVSVQKFILDWAEGKENQDVQLIFPLPFREINLMKDKTLSLSDLLHDFFPETKEMEISNDEYKVLFIFDGLDECRLPLKFKRNKILQDANTNKSVEVLLMNLIVGNLLPSALIWITSRPAAADLIPSECVHRVTEVRGFNEPQKEEYFRKRISDQSLANTIISHLKSSRSLYIMCHIPVFCWISAAVLEKMLSRAESGEIPKTLTQMYTHFLILQTNIKREMDYEKKVTDEEIILKLGKVAFQQLVKGNAIFYEEDLIECGIDVTEASVYSGLCTQIFREELGLYQGKVFCFVHLSIQEHLAALYVHLSCTNNSINVLKPITKQSLLSKVKDWFQPNSSEHVSLSELHQRAVDEALQSNNGHLDLFLRFLLGLSVESHQILLQQIMTLNRSSSDSNEKTVEYIKKKIRIIDSPEKSINLFHCLNELGDHSLVEEIQQYLKSGTIKENKLSSYQLSAVVFVLLTSEKKLDEFDINKFVGENNKAEKLKVLQYLLPVIKVHLNDCGVTDEHSSALTSILRSNPSQLRDLVLIDKNIRDMGMKLLSVVLEDPRCKLEELRKEQLRRRLTLGAEQLRRRRLTLGVEQLRRRRLTLGAEQLRRRRLTLGAEQLRRLGLTLGAEQLRRLGLTLGAEQLRRLGLTLEAEQLRRLGLTLEAEQLRRLGLTLMERLRRHLTVETGQLRRQCLTLEAERMRRRLTLEAERLRRRRLTVEAERLRRRRLTAEAERLRRRRLTAEAERRRRRCLTVEEQQ
ncbi:hypothetical protein QQF64_006560 [Cirrhinus molitorella]|uniref:NACHT domain-containing protein n=1 Tax=Cirrhinus molitorella TaxID=172907 RepID=A0ABR3M9M1_9TELE